MDCIQVEGTPPDSVLPVNIGRMYVAVYELQDGGKINKAVTVLGRLAVQGAYEACVLNEQGFLVLARSLPGFVSVEEEV